MPKEKYLLILALMVIATAVAVGFVLWSNRNLPAETLTKIQKEANPCFGLSPDSGEKTCGEATKLVLAKYPGSIQNIEKVEANLVFGTPPNITVKPKGVWLIKVKLDKPVAGGPHGQITILEIAVDRIDGKMQIILAG